MSLLFDALKRLQTNSEAAEQQAAAPPRPQATPYAAIRPAHRPTTFGHGQEGGVIAAQTIFSATAWPRRAIAPFLVLGLLVLALTGGAAAWLWPAPGPLAAQPPRPATPPSQPLAVVVEPPRATRPPAPPAATPPALPLTAARPVPAATPPPAKTPVEDATSPPPPAATALDDEPAMPMDTPEVQVTTSPPRQGSTPASKPAEQLLATPAGVHVRLSPQSGPLLAGYTALTEGRLEDAERLYREALAPRPQDKDALLGLAVIAHRKLQTEQALGLYQQVLRQDPGNVTATAALATLSAQLDPLTAESRLKQLLDQQPAAPALHHALGSVLARQKRWGEAQQAFGRAASLAPDNALYAYNLAVALDRLQQPAAALHSYEKAAALARPGDVAIDRNSLHRRVEELRSSLPDQPR